MILDILFLIVLVAAVVKGLQRGLIIAAFSVLAFMAGLAAAIKLSTVVAMHLRGSVNLPAKWLPILSFIAVFIVVVLLVRYLAKLIETAVNFGLIGWVDKLFGVALYLLIYVTIFSVLMFYVVKMHLVSSSTLDDSRSYPLIEPFGPRIIDWIGRVIPVFKDMFHDLEAFFEDLSHKIEK